MLSASQSIEKVKKHNPDALCSLQAFNLYIRIISTLFVPYLPISHILLCSPHIFLLYTTERKAAACTAGNSLFSSSHLLIAIIIT